MKNYLAQNLNLAKIGAKISFFENLKFHKIWTLRWIFSKFNGKGP